MDSKITFIRDRSESPIKQPIATSSTTNVNKNVATTDVVKKTVSITFKDIIMDEVSKGKQAVSDVSSLDRTLFEPDDGVITFSLYKHFLKIYNKNVQLFTYFIMVFKSFVNCFKVDVTCDGVSLISAFCNETICKEGSASPTYSTKSRINLNSI